MSDFDKLIALIKESRNIVFFGGAGVSTESGIPDFRSVDGLYNLKYKYPPETMLSHSFFKHNPDDFYSFYRDKVIHTKANPNKAHITLAKLEAMGKLRSIVTQNIDGLHQKAGSKRVHELHGSINRNYCDVCAKSFEVSYIEASDSITPRCNVCGGIVRPDVVLYEEGLDMNVIDLAIKDIRNSDLLIIGGTSLLVQPAASLIEYHQQNRIVLINKESTSADNMAVLKFKDSIAHLLGQVMEVLE